MKTYQVNLSSSQRAAPASHIWIFNMHGNTSSRSFLEILLGLAMADFVSDPVGIRAIRCVIIRSFHFTRAFVLRASSHSCCGRNWEPLPGGRAVINPERVDWLEFEAPFKLRLSRGESSKIARASCCPRQAWLKLLRWSCVSLHLIID